MPSPLVERAILRKVCEPYYAADGNYGDVSLEISYRQCRVVLDNNATFANFRIVVAIGILHIKRNIVCTRSIIANICRILLVGCYSFCSLESPSPRCWRTRRPIGEVNAFTYSNIVRRSNESSRKFAVGVRNITIFRHRYVSILGSGILTVSIGNCQRNIVSTRILIDNAWILRSRSRRITALEYPRPRSRITCRSIAESDCSASLNSCWIRSKIGSQSIWVWRIRVCSRTWETAFTSFCASVVRVEPRFQSVCV